MRFRRSSRFIVHEESVHRIFDTQLSCQFALKGCGGGLTFWDGSAVPSKQVEIDYHTRSGDIAFIDRAVWHQANPITKGTRWALVIFYDAKSKASD